jgi:DNA (cytosine-5)-methyltransferase 1
MTRRVATVVDLFSGAGGLSLGFRAAGARILAAVDASESAGRTFQHNFRILQKSKPPRVYLGDEGDLKDLDLERVALQHEGPDILVGGPPCQGFSRIGRAQLAKLARDAAEDAEGDELRDQDAGDPRNELFRRFVEATRYWKPSAFVMENVPAMRKVNGTNVADIVAEELASCGYRVGHALLNAVWYGVPQFRERLFFIGIRRDLEIVPSAPVPTHTVELPAGYLRPPQTFNLPFSFVKHFEIEVPVGRGRIPATTTLEAIGDLPRITAHLAAGRPAARGDDFRVPREYECPATSPFARRMRTWPKLPVPIGIDDHVIRRTPRDFETFRRMKPDDRYPEALRIASARLQEEIARRTALGTLPAEGTPAYTEMWKSIMPPYPEDKFVDKWRKLTADRPSWTVPAHLSKDAYSHIHYDSEQARAISVREAARLQSFPDAFVFTGNMGDCFTQIGNAVPPVLAWAVAAHLLEVLKFRFSPCSLGS